MQLAIDVCGPERDESLSQFYTPPAVADRIVESLGAAKIRRVLEPSCGLGALVKPMLERGSNLRNFEADRDPFRIDAIDIDQRNIDWCRENITDPACSWECGDYLERPAPAELYCLGLANPPYHDGLDGLILGKMMAECERIVAIIRTESLHGVGRYDQVWRHCDGHASPWVLRAVTLHTRRVNYGGGGGMIETCTVKLSRRRDDENGSVTSCVGWA